MKDISQILNKLSITACASADCIEKASLVAAPVFLQMQRDQTIKSSLYSFLLQKREENQLVLAATTPGSAAAIPAPAMITLIPRACADFAKSSTS